jgi:succinyl-diaminopimelate desuccinylase
MNSVLASVGEFAADLADLDSDVAGMSGPTCNVGTIEGGTKTNVVPSSCSATIDLRIPPDHDADEVRRRLLDAIGTADVPDGAEIGVETVLEADSYRFESDAEHVEVVRENAAETLGRDLPVRGTQGFTDARFFAADGVATVKYGPGDDRSNAHGADESVAVDQIRETAAVVAGSVLDFADR